MKTFKRISIFLMVLAFGVGTIHAFAQDETEIRKVKGFSSVKVSTGIDLYLTMGKTEEVKVVADEDIIDRIKTEVDGSTLRIYMKSNNNWFNRSYNKTRKAYVTVSELKGITASSGSDVKSENTLEGERLAVKVSSGADVELDVVYKDLSVDTSSGSDAKLSGKVKNLEVEASSGSGIKAMDLKSVNCTARASSGSDISVTVSEELTAKASSGGDIRYSGNPKYKDTDESSGGDVRSR